MSSTKYWVMLKNADKGYAELCITAHNCGNVVFIYAKGHRPSANLRQEEKCLKFSYTHHKCTAECKSVHGNVRHDKSTISKTPCRI